MNQEKDSKQNTDMKRYVHGRKKAMYLLNRKDRTEWELRDRLKKAELEEDVIEDAIEYVKSFHYIDDYRYAKHYVSVCGETRSIQRLKQDMKKHHVPTEYINLALEELSWDDSSALEKEVRKFHLDMDELSYDEKRKYAARLYRKGFRSEDIVKALNLYN